jgi:hypothetical protein
MNIGRSPSILLLTPTQVKQNIKPLLFSISIIIIIIIVVVVIIIVVVVVVVVVVDRLCGLVVRDLGYRSRGLGSILDAIRFSEK